MRTKELPAIEYPADYDSNDNHTYFPTVDMADNPNKQVRTQINL